MGLSHELAFATCVLPSLRYVKLHSVKGLINVVFENPSWDKSVIFISVWNQKGTPDPLAGFAANTFFRRVEQVFSRSAGTAYASKPL